MVSDIAGNGQPVLKGLADEVFDSDAGAMLIHRGAPQAGGAIFIRKCAVG